MVCVDLLYLTTGETVIGAYKCVLREGNAREALHLSRMLGVLQWNTKFYAAEILSQV